MTQIEKIKAEIDRSQETTMDENRNFLSSYHEGIFDGLSLIDNFIDSLEVKEKEVNLEQEIQQHINDCLDIKFQTTDIKMVAKDVEYTARKFFELGLKAKGE